MGFGYSPINANVRLNKQYGFDTYGFFEQPSDFTPVLPCNFYRDASGDIQHDMAFTGYIGGTEIYVNQVTGNDSTGDGTSGAPYKTLTKAFNVVAAGASGSYQIIVKSDTIFTRDEMIGTITLTDKIVSLRPDNTSGRIIATCQQTGLSFSADDNTWKATRSNCYTIFDRINVDSEGKYTPYVCKATLAECKATAKSWYTDNTYIWINNDSESAPTVDDTCINVSAITPAITLAGTSKLYFKNLDMYIGSSLAGLQLIGTIATGEAAGEAVFDNCGFFGGNLRVDQVDYANAFYSQNVKLVYMFNCIGAYAKRDGLGYHFANVDADKRRNCFILEYNCKGYSNGHLMTTNMDNATTCHEGVNILRIGTQGDGKDIPLADVGGCYSICIDCYMANAGISSGTYYFDGAGKAILITAEVTMIV
jgi:hypothetical protein